MLARHLPSTEILDGGLSTAILAQAALPSRSDLVTRVFLQSPDYVRGAVHFQSIDLQPFSSSSHADMDVIHPEGPISQIHEVYTLDS